MEDIASISDDYGIHVCIENMPAWDSFLLRYPDLDLGSNGFVLDIGHANTVGNLPEFLDKDSYHISHFHLHDNSGVTDEHLPIGEGNVDMNLLIPELRSNRSIKIVENKNALDVSKSIDALLKMGIR